MGLFGEVVVGNKLQKGDVRVARSASAGKEEGGGGSQEEAGRDYSDHFSLPSICFLSVSTLA